jgi:outer membrane lipoprotein carrier protein
MILAKSLGRGCMFAAAAILCVSLSAQQSAPSAHDMAQRVDRHYNELHSLKSSFSETYEGMGMKRTESGTLLLEKPGRMKWEYSVPSGKIFLLDGRFAWFYTNGDARVQRISAKKIDDLRSPLRFLLGHTELEKEIGNLTMSVGTNGVYTLTGQPKGLENRVRHLSLKVTADGEIKTIEVEETNGALTFFTFSGERTNVTIPPAAFKFTPPPGVPVVDALPPA